jgi:hypothetical protein
MKRQTVYAGQVPLETDLLNTNKNVLTAIGHVLQDMLGTSTLFSGLACVPTAPAGMTVNVNPGRAYSLQAIDTGAWSSLAADTHQIMKQGILLDAQNFSCPAPTTAGFSINYLIQGAFQEVDTGSTVLPYYNATNPSQAYNGPNGTGTSQTTARDNTVQLQVKAGVAATTGSQITPTPDAGFNGLWVVTVPFGASTITSANISQYIGAPFLTAPLLSQIQSSPGRLLRTSIYTNVGGTQYVSVNGATPTTTGASSWTALSTTNAIEYEGCGGGAGASGAGGQGSSTVGIGASGGSGSWGRGRLLAGFSGTQSVTVGAGGTAGTSAPSNGGSGSATSLGALASWPGGGASTFVNGVTTPAIVGAGAGGAAPTGCNIFGSAGNSAEAGIFASTSVGVSGKGGDTPYGAGGQSVAAGAPGQPGSGYGSGASGAAVGGSGTGQPGAVGANGILIIREYS